MRTAGQFGFGSAGRFGIGVALALLALGACGDDDGEALTTPISTDATAVTTTSLPTTTSSPTTTFLATATTTAATVATPLPSSGPLSKGTYVVTAFRPQFTFDVPATGVLEAFAPAQEDHFDILAANFDRTAAYFAVLRAHTVFTDFFVRDPIQPNANGKTAPAPANLVAWLRSVPALQVSAEETLQVAGRPAHRVTVKVATLESGKGGCSANDECVTLFRYKDGVSYFGMESTTTEVLTVVDMADGVPLVFVARGDATFLAQAHALLAGARFS